MTDETKPAEEAAAPATEPKGRDWAKEAEEALEGVGDALKDAWDASRDARVGALESARHAMKQLGEAIDHGIAAARQKWEAEQGEAEEGGVTPPTVDHLPEKENPAEDSEADED